MARHDLRMICPICKKRLRRAADTRGLVDHISDAHSVSREAAGSLAANAMRRGARLTKNSGHFSVIDDGDAF